MSVLSIAYKHCHRMLNRGRIGDTCTRGIWIFRWYCNNERIHKIHINTRYPLSRFHIRRMLISRNIYRVCGCNSFTFWHSSTINNPLCTRLTWIEVSDSGDLSIGLIRLLIFNENSKQDYEDCLQNHQNNRKLPSRRHIPFLFWPSLFLSLLFLLFSLKSSAVVLDAAGSKAA